MPTRRATLGRRLLNGLSATSLVLCAILVVLWMRSYGQGHFGELIGTVTVHTRDDVVTFRDAGIVSSHGYFALGTTRCDYQPGDPNFVRFRPPYPQGTRLVWGPEHTFERYPFRFASRNFLGVWGRDWTFVFPTSVQRSTGAAVPYWMLVLATAVLPAAWEWRFMVRHRRRRAGQCVACGYDLRVTPDRCPECGAVPAGVA